MKYLKLYLVGYFNYECGYHFEQNRFEPLNEQQSTSPLAWFGAYSQPFIFDHSAGAFLNHTAKYGLSALMLAVVRGHVDVVRTLVWCGADTSLRGTGAPGFADKTALDLAVDRNDAEMVRMLGTSAEPGQRRALNPHFEMVDSWSSARARLTFQPVAPKETAGRRLEEV